MLNIVEDLARSFGLLLDSLFYPLIVNLYNLFFNIVKITIANPDTIQKFAQRIYVLIAVFMIFKITVSMISWFASPDSVSDSNKGSSNLVKRIIISLLLLGSVNYIFNFAFRVQYIILNENLIGNIIMGNSTQANFQDTVMKGGDMVATSVFQGFFFPENTTQDEEEMYHKRAEQNNWSLFSSYAMSVVNKRNGEDYAFHYQAYVSTIAGLVVAWILLIFCIDMAVRCVTLGFLQIIAPVPILSYIDQKKGEKVFNNWLQTCISTYLEVFVKLIAIFFGIFLIGELLAHDLLQYNSEGNAIPYDSLSGYFPRMFIIVGILIFVGKLPQLVADMLGVKKMDFTLNPLKKLGASPIATGFIAGGLGMAGGFAANLMAGKGIGSALAGAGSSGFRSMYGGFTSQGKSNPFASAKKGIGESVAARDRREVYKNQGYGFSQRLRDRMDKFAGIKNKDGGIGQLDSKIKENQVKIDNNNSAEQALRNAQAVFASEHPNSKAIFNNLRPILNERKIILDRLYENPRDTEATEKLIEVEYKINRRIENVPDRDNLSIYMNYSDQIDQLDRETKKLTKENKNMQNVLDRASPKDK